MSTKGEITQFSGTGLVPSPGRETGAPMVHETDELVSEALANRLADNTIRAYRSQFDLFRRWCESEDMVALVAEPITVARYLALRGSEGASMSTVSLSKSAISAAHRDAGAPDPTVAHAVLETMRGLQRIHARGQRQASALSAEALAAIRSTAMIPRLTLTGRIEKPENARSRGLLDIAICCLMSDAGLRRSEASSLTWSDISVEPDGSGRVTILRSKTDPAAEGAVVAITSDAVEALWAIRPDDASQDDLVFGLSAASISRHIKAAAKAANLGTLFSGHSGRVGCALRMTTMGAPMQAVMTQGRWKDARTVVRYTRSLAAGEALRYL